MHKSVSFVERAPHPIGNLLNLREHDSTTRGCRYGRFARWTVDIIYAGSEFCLFKRWVHRNGVDKQQSVVISCGVYSSTGSSLGDVFFSFFFLPFARRTTRILGWHFGWIVLARKCPSLAAPDIFTRSVLGPKTTAWWRLRIIWANIGARSEWSRPCRILCDLDALNALYSAAVFCCFCGAAIPGRFLSDSLLSSLF